MIVAIDGPAGAGKSTTAREVARRFGFAYIDTGAMYRAVALAASERDLEAGRDDASIIELARSLPLRLTDNGDRICIGERDISALIRTPQIGALTSAIAVLPGVREVIVAQQRRIGRESIESCGGAVLEGRDIQTVVFPDAPVKIFLTADAGTRAARRMKQWRGDAATTGRIEQAEIMQAASGTPETTQAETAPAENSSQQTALDEARHDIESRDERDSGRQTSPLRAADDAFVLATDGLSCEQVVERIAQIVRGHLVDSTKSEPPQP